MYKIQLLNQISEVGLALLVKDKYDYNEEIKDPDGIILRSSDMHDMDFSKSTLSIARAGAGVNNIPIDRCSSEGIVVFNTPGANANAVKELVFESMLLSTRKVHEAMNWVQSLKGTNQDVEKLAEKNKSNFIGPELYGKTLGVIGLGAIGIQVCNTAVHFGMDVYGYDPYISVDGAWQLSRSVKHAESLEDVFKNCDFISIHVPLNKETENMINKETIQIMKDNVRLFNFARGGLVNNTDVIEAVAAGKVNTYVTDFATEELLGHDNIIVLPHLGASTPESEENCAKMAARQMRDFLENGNIVNSVNLPDVKSPRTSKPRITVFHENKPNMISQITGTVGENIDNLQNRSKGDFAYTLLDLDSDVSNDLVDKLENIKGVIRVRLIK